VSKFVVPGLNPFTLRVVESPTFDVKSRVTLDATPTTALGAETLKEFTEVPSVTLSLSVTAVVPAVNVPTLIPKVCDAADPLTSCDAVIVS
jgi:hypothetical protein